MRIVFFVCVLLTSGMCRKVSAQITVSTDYLTKSEMSDKEGNRYGDGSMMKYNLRASVPVSVKQNGPDQTIAWGATLKATLATMSNNGEAITLNPAKMLDVSVNMSHTRPLSHRWQLLLSAGVGVYANPSAITASCILANGAVIFAYRLSDRLHVGLGGGADI